MASRPTVPFISSLVLTILLAGCSLDLNALQSGDAGPRDAGMDSGAGDGGTEAGPRDGGAEAGPVDAGPVDAGPVDAGPVDAAADAEVDSGSPDAGPLCVPPCRFGSHCILREAEPTCVECEHDRHCGDSSPYCNPDGRCDECLSDGDCARGICDTAIGTCRVGACEECDEHASCQDDMVCVVLAGELARCAVDTARLDCSKGYSRTLSVSDGTGTTYDVCVPPLGVSCVAFLSTEAQAECLSEEICGSGAECETGVCTHACGEDGDCPGTFECSAASGLCTLVE